MKNKIVCGAIWLSALVFATAGSGAEFQKPSQSRLDISVSDQFQPHYQDPKKYTSNEMRILADEVLRKMAQKLGVEFDRTKPEHVRILAECFGLMMNVELDKYSTPMTDSDILYFVDLEQFGSKELYPQNKEQLVIRFYWEGLARLAALHYKLRVVDNRFAAHPRMSRGKVSDMATTAMFDKHPGISIAEAVREGKEKYDFGRLIQHLREKGLATAPTS